jgi:hypothetical protein
MEGTMKKLITVGLVLLGFGTASAEVYRECKINNGSASSSCGSRYSGTAVVEKDGVYRECKVNSGSVSSSCGGRYNGTAVVEKSGVFRECKINNGKLGSSCGGSRYSGKAVIPK